MPIVVFQHSELCRPGRLGLTLRDHTFRLDIRRLNDGDPVPADFDDIDAVISLGGPQNVGESHPWMAREMEFLREAHDRGMPVVGVCLGAQLIAAALGGNVGKMTAPEMGFINVDLQAAGQTDTILAGVAWRSPQFQSHEYEVTELPAGATLLASSQRCKVQAYKAGHRTYGFQYHLECDRAGADAIVEDGASDLAAAGLSLDEYRRQRDYSYEMFARLSDRVCVNIATFLIPKVATLVK